MQILVKKIGKGITVLLGCLFLVLAGLPAVQAQGESGNRTVKAGIFYFDGYHMEDGNGKMSGYGIEFLDLVSEYSHLNFEYEGYGKSWDEMLEMLETGQIDVVTLARKTKERSRQFAFTLPVGRSRMVLSVRSDNSRFHNGDYADYDGMVIGIMEGSSQNKSLEQFAKEKKFSYQAREYRDSEEMVAALQDGSVDAVLSSDLRKTEDEKTLDIIQSENFYAAVRKEDDWLLDEMNYAIEQMNINEGDWSNELFYKYYGPEYPSALTFTEREKDYIKDVVEGKKKITATAAGDHSPYSYVEDGELKGILPEYFQKAMDMAGLPYEIVIPGSRDEYDNFTQMDGIDVVIDNRTSGTADEYDTGQGFRTDVYMSTGMAKVTRHDFTGKVSSVAVAKTQGNIPFEQGVVGDAAVIEYGTRKEALQAVIDRKADAAYMYTYTAQMFVNNDFTDSLHYSIMNGIQYQFQMYVKNSSDHELVTILNKCIQQIPEDVLNQLITEYTSYTSKDLTFTQYMKAHPMVMAAIILMAAIAIGLILALIARAKWNGKVLKATEEQLAIVDALSRDYSNVFAIDSMNGTVKGIKIGGYMPLGLKRNPGEESLYDEVLSGYIQERVHPADRQYLEEALSMDTVVAKLDRNREYTGSFRVLADGKIFNFQFTYARIEGINAKKEGFILAGFRNIDEMVRKEQEQKEALAEALAEAQHANQAKTAFLNNMSHDIRTPMNAIIGFTSLAAAHIESTDLVKSYLDKIMTASRHLLSLINDVLDMSRIESGKVRIEEKEASLPEIMHDLKIIVQSEIKAKQIEFYIDTVDVVDENIICDKLRLNQVLLNILSNAMKYTKPGGMVSVRIIQSDCEQKGFASYEFRIKDNGIGMSKEFMEHLFEPFERERTSTISGIQGTGLGLAITKNIVDMMGGAISVDSQEGKGTEFCVSFRFRISGNPAKIEKIEELIDLRALIVDDDINICTSVSKMLSSIGMHPDWTTQGKEAVVRTQFALEQNEPYSTYIIDWLMPDMNGIEVVRRIRKMIGGAPTVIILTAYDWADVEEEAKEAGVTAFCAKPLFLSELREILAAPFKEEQGEKGGEQKNIFAGRKLLLVEDNEINQEIAKAILEEEGFTVDIADDGSVAVEIMEKAQNVSYDLILMDIQMSVMNGYEATRAIRAMDDPVKSSIPIIAMTADAFEEDRQMAMEAGMDGHVAKPIDVPKLMETLQVILGQKAGKASL